MQHIASAINGIIFGGSAYAVLRIKPDATTPLGLLIFCASCLVLTGALIHKGLTRPNRKGE